MVYVNNQSGQTARELVEVAIKDVWRTYICAKYGRTLVYNMYRWLEAIIKNSCGHL